MRLNLFFLLLLTPLVLWSQPAESLKAPGLQEPVEVLRDENGVNHIYARNEHDLFFAQGYCAARDRMYQFEIWRRQATGTVAEILGEREIRRDIGSRLFRFRGDLNTEFAHYHPRGGQIIRAFTDGVNAWIARTEQDPSLLPMEFRLLGIRPVRWTPDVVISRHQGLLNNLTEELNVARAVAAIGAEKTKKLFSFEPGDPDITLDKLIDPALLASDLIAPYEAFRKPLSFLPSDLKTSATETPDDGIRTAEQDRRQWEDFLDREREVIGSNNWVVSGSKAAGKFPMLANDPHRAITTPSLRYLVHLNAPGWNVVGGGEPVIPGVSIGHNDHGAWGLTVFDIDAEDLYIYELDPKNPRRYRYKGGFEDMKVIRDTIRVKDHADVYVEHLYTRHGPVTMVDEKNGRAAAVRCGWLEPGSAPYMASLRMAQATNWTEFREACSKSYLPGENMIWADRTGDIGWQAAGIAPVRPNWSGMVPVPGDGRYEWSGFLPVKSLPNAHNPARGFVATANENNVPAGYAHRNAVGWTWAENYRFKRIEEVLLAGKNLTLQDMMNLQFDYLAIPARELVPMVLPLTSSVLAAEEARGKFKGWDFVLGKESVAAGIYVAWENELEKGLIALLVPSEAKTIRGIPTNKVIALLKDPAGTFGSAAARDQFLIRSLEKAVASLTEKLGADQSKWNYGQPAYHHSRIRHQLSYITTPEVGKKLDHGPLPRGGYNHTPGMTTSSDNQLAGASFRIAVDTRDWDNCMFTNSPGQSGDPDSPFYGNLFEKWANDHHFPVRFTRAKVEAAAVGRLQLVP
ncbi:MAG: penicillin acylase family protein [Bacteroidota bacterium]